MSTPFCNPAGTSARGKAWCDGESRDLAKGDTPNEGFAELIRAGATEDLDAADRAVVSG